LPIPVEVVFNPNWWFRNYAIAFDESFYFDRQCRIENDLAMRRALYQRFGIGEANSQPRPVVGSQHVAGGFVVPALLGAEIRFSKQDAPWPVPAGLSRERILALQAPDIERTWPMDRLIAGMDAVEEEFGRLIGDFNTDGVLNTALQLRGHQLFFDMLEDPELTGRLFEVIARTQCLVARYMRRRTGTASVAVNRSILNVDPQIYLHGNCAVQMISPTLYRNALLAWDCRLARELAPFGIHHCGGNFHLYAEAYAATGARFYDIGWGSDVRAASAALPGAFVNLRLSPVRLLSESAEQVRQDVLELLTAAGRTTDVGICCINMDYGTPDANVSAIFAAVAEFDRPQRHRGTEKSRF
jgi:hypothetical protein